MGHTRKGAARPDQQAQFLQVHGLQRHPPADLQPQLLPFLSSIGVTETMFILLLSMSGQKRY
jgi:hypothetical protein